MAEKKKILICDDEPLLRDLIAAQLSMHGFDAEEAEDGVQCVEKAIQIHPSAILLDINLPKMNGMEVLEKLKSYQIDCPIIIITGSSDQEKIQYFKDHGVDKILYKPFHLGTLEEQLKELLVDVNQKTK